MEIPRPMLIEMYQDPATGDVIVNGRVLSRPKLFALADALERDYGHKPSTSLPLAYQMCVTALALGQEIDEML